MRAIYLIFLFLLTNLLLSCSKPNPNPELLDPIYMDLQNEKKSVEAEIEAEGKMRDEFADAIRKAVPHTGQIKFAQKRFFDSEGRLTKLKQRLEYYTFKIESRKKLVKVEYLKSFRKKEPWPKPEEYKDYLVQKNLDRSPPYWVVRKRIEESKKPVPRGTKEGEAPAGGH